MTYIRYTSLGAVKQRVLSDFVDRTPVPPVEDYAIWLATQSLGFQQSWSAHQLRRVVVMLRRVVVMLRRYESQTDIGRAIGKSQRTVSSTVARLPDHLK